jgi:hypothetical protein
MQLKNGLDKRRLMFWNGRQSPDFNPIENLWKELKLRIHRKNPHNLPQL